MNNNTKYGYIDKTDYDWELGEAFGGNIIYASVEDLLRHQPCAKECGILKVKIQLEEVIAQRKPYKEVCKICGGLDDNCNSGGI